MFFLLVVTGQLTSSLVVDHFGAFGFTPKPADTMRIVGVCVAIFGGMMVSWKAGHNKDGLDKAPTIKENKQTVEIEDSITTDDSSFGDIVKDITLDDLVSVASVQKIQNKPK